MVAVIWIAPQQQEGVEDTTEEVEGECSVALLTYARTWSRTLVAEFNQHWFFSCLIYLISLLCRSAYGANNRTTVPKIDEADGGGGGGSSYGGGCDLDTYVNFPGL